MTTPSPGNSRANGLPLGLTGAVSATRYVGGTATVAPTTGTFAVGDFVITQNGKVYICTVAGTPGTWVLASGTGTVTSVTAADASIVVAGTAADPTIAVGKAPGYQWDYAQITSDGTSTQTTESSATAIITGNSITYDGAAVIIIVSATDINNATGGIATVVNVWRDSTDIGRVSLMTTPAALSISTQLYGTIKDTPTAAAHTYSARLWVSSASTGIVRAGAGGAGTRAPAYLRVVKV